MNFRRLQGLSTALLLGLAAALLLGLLAAGCGRSHSAEGEVTGCVRYNGQPLPWGTVTFLAADDRKLSAVIEEGGRYRVDKLPVGSYQIGVISRPDPAPIPPHAERPGSKPPAEKNPFNIPQRYGKPTKSGLTYVVRKGPQNHDIELTPEP
jgi:hypothetical protein